MTAAALRVADAEGLSAVSFRRLASELGVSTMAPYSYFEDKSDLLDAMVGYALRRPIRARDSDAGWEELLVQAMRDMREVFSEHPALIELIGAHYIDDEELNQFREYLFAIMKQAGLRPNESSALLTVLGDYVLGSVFTQRRRGLTRDDAQDPFELGIGMLMDSLRARVGGNACARPPG